MPLLAQASTIPKLSSELIKMGTKMQHGVPEISLIAHAPPDIDGNAQIIGICTVATTEMGSGRYGWMVADFLKWKTLLQAIGPGDNQTWISRIDMDDFMKACGRPYADDATMIKQCENIVVRPDPQLLTETILKTIRDRARIAQERRKPLFLLICGPVSPDQDICIELSQPLIILTRATIRDAIRKAVDLQNVPHAILMASSALTAGWVCHPVLCGEQHKILDPKDIMELLARSFGSTFGVSIIDNFTSSKSPFLSIVGRNKFSYYDLMPVGPSSVQVENLHAFHAKIHETLKHRFCPLALKHDFNFNYSSSDYWALLTKFRETPLRWWADHWHGEENMQSAGYPFLGNAFGGCYETQIFHLKYLVEVELHTCRGDWDNASTGITRQLFEDFLVKPISAITEIMVKRILNAIEYRASCTALVEMVARLYSLPFPDDKTCRFWHDQHSGDDTFYKRRQLAFRCLNNLFDNMVLLPGEFHNQFSIVRFQRPYRWLAASFAQGYHRKSDEELETFIEVGVQRFFEILKDNQVGLLQANNAINEFAKQWLQSITPGYEDGDIMPFIASAAANATKATTSAMARDDVQLSLAINSTAGQADPHSIQEMAPQILKKEPYEQTLKPSILSAKGAPIESMHGLAKADYRGKEAPRVVEVATVEQKAEIKKLGSEAKKASLKQEKVLPTFTTVVSNPRAAKEQHQISQAARMGHLSGQEFMSKILDVFSQGGIDISSTMPLVEDLCSKLSILNTSEAPQQSLTSASLSAAQRDEVYANHANLTRSEDPERDNASIAGPGTSGMGLGVGSEGSPDWNSKIANLFSRRTASIPATALGATSSSMNVAGDEESLKKRNNLRIRRSPRSSAGLTSTVPPTGGISEAVADACRDHATPRPFPEQDDISEKSDDNGP